MDIIIRNVDPVAIKKIDEMAKEKKLSRQEFLKSQIDTLAFYREQTTRERDLQTIIHKNIMMMKDCYDSMEKMNEFVSIMMQEDA